MSFIFYGIDMFHNI